MNTRDIPKNGDENRGMADKTYNFKTSVRGENKRNHNGQMAYNSTIIRS